MSAASPLRLALNRQARTFDALNGSSTQLPGFYQNNVIDFQLTITDPPAVTAGKPSVVNYAGYALDVTLSDTPKGNAGNTLYAQITDIAFDVTNGFFAGSLDLTTTDIVTLLGANASATATLEFDIKLVNVKKFTYQATVTIFAVSDKPASNAPSPGNPSYLTANETKSAYVPYVLGPGVGIQFTSPDSQRIQTWFLDNDGIFKPAILQ